MRTRRRGIKECIKSPYIREETNAEEKFLKVTDDEKIAMDKNIFRIHSMKTFQQPQSIIDGVRVNTGIGRRSYWSMVIGYWRWVRRYVYYGKTSHLFALVIHILWCNHPPAKLPRFAVCSLGTRSLVEAQYSVIIYHWYVCYNVYINTIISSWIPDSTTICTLHFTTIDHVFIFLAVAKCFRYFCWREVCIC